MNISEIIKLMRPHQWIKNLFLFLPMFFGNRMFDGECLLSVSIAFAAFSLLSSSVYCFNDIQDYALDKLHPERDSGHWHTTRRAARCSHQKSHRHGVVES